MTNLLRSYVFEVLCYSAFLLVFFASFERNLYFVNLPYTYVTGWHLFVCGQMLVCYIFAPSMACVCCMRSTYDEEVAAVSRRPCHPLIQILSTYIVCTVGRTGFMWMLKQ